MEYFTFTSLLITQLLNNRHRVARNICLNPTKPWFKNCWESCQLDEKRWKPTQYFKCHTIIFIEKIHFKTLKKKGRMTVGWLTKKKIQSQPTKKFLCVCPLDYRRHDRQKCHHLFSNMNLNMNLNESSRKNGPQKQFIEDA